MRPYLLFVSGITGIAGLSFAADFSPTFGLLLAATFFLSYGFGQALTDCFQTDTDSISSPYRPLVRGTIRKGDVFVVSVIGLTACGLVMVLGNLNAIPLAVMGILGLASYTYFKRRWWAGPFYNAWIVAVVYLIGVLDGVPGAGFADLWHPEVLATAAVVFFGYANFVLSGYFKDISADRATGYNTLPVRYGMRVSSLISDLFAALSAVGSGIVLVLIDTAGDHAGLPLTALFVAGAGLGASLVAQARLHQVRDEREAHRAINPVVHAYVLLLSAIAVAQQPQWAPFLAVFYAAFWITMWRRPATEQI
jgi:4-hydroxybenzoate polyprenyltransferase